MADNEMAKVAAYIEGKKKSPINHPRKSKRKEWVNSEGSSRPKFFKN